MTALRVVLEVDHAPNCRAPEWQQKGSAADWIASTWTIRNTSELWLTVSCNDPLCHAAGLISQESILEHARSGLAKATAERPWTPDAVEERDRIREEKRLAAGGAPRVEDLDDPDPLVDDEDDEDDGEHQDDDPTADPVLPEDDAEDAPAKELEEVST